jgi:hypothetical protein
MRWTKDKCSANTSNFKYSCYTRKQLLDMKTLWNKKHPDAKVSATSSKDIWGFFKKKFRDCCYRESCWLKKEFIKRNIDDIIINNTFAPDIPSSWIKNPVEWLDSNNISAVMKQYEYNYPNFRFIGPSPINYAEILHDNNCVWDELCNFELDSYIENGVNKFGIIFNLDEHDEEGSHWVCLFIDINKEELYYFDSYGFRIVPKINTFSKNIIKQSKESDNVNTFTRYSNKIEHQTKTDSECGMYCLYIIIELLKGKDFLDDLVKKRIPDSVMLKHRKIYFNN